MNETAAMKIVSYMENYLDDPVKYRWSKNPSQFSDRSTEQWCAGEILKLILDNPETDPQELIAVFTMRLIKCQYVARRRKSKEMLWVFQLAEDIATDIYLEFFCHE